MITAPIRILLVEDHLMMRAALRLLLSAQPGLEIVGETGNCESAVNMALRLRPDIVLLDFVLSNRSSVESIPQLSESKAWVLMLTGSADEDWHPRAFELGARGIVRKEQPIPILMEAIERVQAGHLWLDPALPDQQALNRDSLPAPIPRLQASNFALPNFAPSSRDAFGAASLTPREREVIYLIGDGMRNKQLAERLGVSEKTIHNHLSSIFRKLGVRDRLELATFARLNHLLEPPSPIGDEF